MSNWEATVQDKLFFMLSCLVSNNFNIFDLIHIKK